MNLNQLRYFKILADIKHYTRAAEILGISQPSLSYGIKQLENELGFALFEKSGRNIKLSDAGKSFLDYLIESEEIMTTGIKSIKKQTDVYNRTLDIAYIAPLASKFIPTIVSEYTKLKGVTIHLYLGTSNTIIEGLKEGKFDIGFCSFLEGETDLSFHPLLRQDMVFIVPESYDTSNLQEISLEEICQQEIITYDKSFGLGMTIYLAMKQQNMELNVKYYVQDELILAGLVESGVGVGLAADSSVFNAFKIKRVPITDQFILRKIFRVMKKDAEPKVQDFNQYLNKYDIDSSALFFS